MRALLSIDGRRAGIEDLRFHDWRHEAVSRFVEAGPLHHVQEMPGHSNLKQTSTYVNARHVDLAETMKKFDQPRAASRPAANLPVTDPRLVRNASAPSGSKRHYSLAVGLARPAGLEPATPGLEGPLSE